MPVLTVLTPAHSSAREWLPATAQSVLSQDLPSAWQLEWVVQSDGSEGNSLADVLPDDERIRFDSNDAQLGPAMTRNLGLARAQGTFVQTLDADDLFVPNALRTVVTAIEAHPEVHWIYAQADDLMPNGERVSFEPWMRPTGLVPAGRLPMWIEQHGGNVPMPCAAVAYRTTTLRAMGGWMALPSGEDVGLLAAVSAVTDGWQDPATTWLYRQHEQQTSRHDTHPRWSAIARQVALQRFSAVQLTDLSITGVADETDHSPRVDDVMKKPATFPS